MWTKRAVELDEIKAARQRPTLDCLAESQRGAHRREYRDLRPGPQLAGCILPGIHEVLRRQGLFETTACLDPRERLSPGQAREITRVARTYPVASG